ncbi:MFS transporter [Hyphomicrobium sp. 99]|uniref:MFS transporter n=1 Tax=Hyphomicrobium sp. 99 TaxID=1163419 RepID=UPI0005F7E240|nr:MFS transporter [Hyphomicrobium sp. 99]
MRGFKGPVAPSIHAPSKRSQIGVDWFAFFLADAQVGFGPFLTVYLTSEKWTNADIGIVLTVGSLIALLGQLPAGALVDAVGRERTLAATCTLIVGATAFSIAIWPTFYAVFLAQVFHSGASVVIGPALAAISLGLVGHNLIGERLGRNARFSSLGSMFAAASMGACGYYLSSQAVFFVSAAMTIPAVMALYLIQPSDFHREELEPKPEPEYHPLHAAKTIISKRPLLILAASVGLFHLANAAVLPLAANLITLRSSRAATVLVALCIIVPQFIVALISPWMGRYGDQHGRRPLLLLGFAALPVRAVLFSYSSDPIVMVAIQLLDGISASALGVLVAGVVADVTQDSGNFNLALGFVGVSMGLGASISTTLAGEIALHFGTSAAFLTLAVIGLIAFLVVTLAMPETRNIEEPVGE